MVCPLMTQSGHRRSMRLLILAGEKWRYAAHCHTAVCPFRRIRRDFQVLFAISLRGKIFRRLCVPKTLSALMRWQNRLS
jgi:hypothetical protein